MAADDTPNDQEEPIQDDRFDPFGGEDEEEEVADDIKRHFEEEEETSPDEQEAERFQQESEDEQEEEEEEEEEQAGYEVYKPNHSSHNPSPNSHAIVSCSTTAGPLLMHFHRAWSPEGYERATTLFERGYYDHSHFFRVVPHFLVQFGIGYVNNQKLKQFASTTIPDDPKRPDLLPFKEGMMSFAGSGPNSRSSQMFIAYDKAGSLGTSPWETPFGEIIGEDSFETARGLFSGYGDMPPWGKGPQQGPIHNQGSKYIEENFPNLDKFHTCSVKRVSEIPKPGAEKVEASGNVRKGGVKDHGGTGKIVMNVKMENQPIMKLALLLGGAVIVILLVGLRGRKKKKDNKSV